MGILEEDRFYDSFPVGDRKGEGVFQVHLLPGGKEHVYHHFLSVKGSRVFYSLLCLTFSDVVDAVLLLHCKALVAYNVQAQG